MKSKKEIELMKKIKCPNCGCTVAYEDKSVREGNRDFEDVTCQKCKEYLTKVFTDGFPNPYVI